MHTIRNIIITNCVGRDRKNRALKNVEKCGGYPDENGKQNEKIGKIRGWVVEIWWKKNAAIEQKKVGGCFLFNADF